jgi:hypothetical protein
MAQARHTKAAKASVKKAATSKSSIASLTKKVKTALGGQGTAAAKRKRTGASTRKTKAELYEIAKRRGLPGRSKMGRDELARKLGKR